MSVNPDGDVILVEGSTATGNTIICPAMPENFVTKKVAGINEICKSIIYDNDVSVGIGNFSAGNEPQSAFHINTNLITGMSFSEGEVFRTDCTPGESTYWRMFNGGQEKAIFYNPAVSPAGGDDDLVIEAPVGGSHILFNVSPSITRMIITDGQSGNVGIGYNFYTPTSLLHLHDGNYSIYQQFTNNSSMPTGALPTATDGLKLGILSDGTAIINQQEDRNLLVLVGTAAQSEQMRIIGVPGNNYGFVGIGNSFTNLYSPKRRVDIFDNSGNPQFRLSHTLNLIPSLGIYTDFRTTDNGDLLINPVNSFLKMSVGINNDNSTLPLRADIDVNGMACVRELPLAQNEDIVATGSNIDKVVVANDNGVLYWRDAATIGGIDYDWEHLPNGVFSGHINSGGFNDKPVWVGLQPSWSITSVTDVIKFGVWTDQAGHFPLNLLTESYAGIFYNKHNHTNFYSFNYGTYSVADGTGIIDNTYNIGVRGRAENAYINYGGHFSAQSNFSTYSAVGVFCRAPGNGNTPSSPWTNFNWAAYCVGDIFYSGTPYTSSDYRLKDSLQAIDNTLSKIRNLNPSSFVYKFEDYSYLSLPEGKQFGFIAQELETVFPELVRTVINPAQFDSLGNMEHDTLQINSINYNGLIPILAEGIIELAEITDSLGLEIAKPDSDWEKTNEGIVSGHYEHNTGYNDKHVMVGADIPDLPWYPMYSKFTAFEKYSENKNSATGYFLNKYNENIEEGKGVAVLGVSTGARCFSKNTNYGGYFFADSAYYNIGGYFKANCGCKEGATYGIYASAQKDCKEAYAGYFEGNVLVTGDITKISDINFKENIIPLTSSMQIIDQLNPIKFNYKQNAGLTLPDSIHYGLIAQEFETILPELVALDRQPAVYDIQGNLVSDTIDFKSINYVELIPILIQGMKELSAQNQSLQDQITQMQDVIATCCASSKSGKIEDFDIDSEIEISPDKSLELNTVLYQNNPNPFNYKTTFNYKIGIDGFIELEIHDQYGNFITNLVSENQKAGNYSVDWNATDIAAGIYFYSLKVNGITWVKKAIKIN